MTKKDPYGRTKETVEAWAAIKNKDRLKMDLEQIGEARGLRTDIFINAGTAAMILPARGEMGMGQSVRLEPGDFVEGNYYEKCLKLARGLQRLCYVDDARLNTLAKQKRIRDGHEYPDWIKEAKSKLGEIPSTLETPTDQFMGEDPADRLARASAEGRPHAEDEKKGK